MPPQGVCVNSHRESYDQKGPERFPKLRCALSLYVSFDQVFPFVADKDGTPTLIRTRVSMESYPVQTFAAMRFSSTTIPIRSQEMGTILLRFGYCWPFASNGNVRLVDAPRSTDGSRESVPAL